MSEPDIHGQRAVAYVRVSMAREDMISPELQVLAVADYCKRRGYKIVKTLEDLDLSGRFWNRRQVELAVQMIERNEADLLVVWRWSRVSRNRLDWALAVNRVESVGGRLESATEGFDTTTATGRLARGMMAEFAAYESDRMGDIWREVRERRTRMGLTATGHEQFGYLKVQGRYVIDPKLGPVLARVYRRYIAGESFRSLSLWLTKRGYHTARPHKPGVGWPRQTLIQVMDRGFAAGYVIGDGEFVAGSHKPLITDEEWQAYQRRRAETRWHKRTTSEPFLLGGLLHCQCGNHMGTTHGSPNSKATYRCHRHGGVDRVRAINQNRVDPLVHEWVIRLASDPATAATATEAARSFAHARWQDARRLARQCSTSDPEHLALLEAELSEAETDSRFPDPSDLAQALREDWGDLTTQRQNTKLRELIAHITLDATYTTPVLTVTTTWGTTERLAGLRGALPGPLSPQGPLPSSRPPMRLTDPDQLLGTGEAAKFLGVSRSTVNKWRRLKLLPNSVPVGNGYFRHTLGDLRRIQAAPTCTTGRSHAALCAEIARSP